MLTAEEARYLVERNLDNRIGELISSLYYIIEDAAEKGSYSISFDEGVIELINRFDCLDNVKKELTNNGFFVKETKHPGGFVMDLLISWKPEEKK